MIVGLDKRAAVAAVIELTRWRCRVPLWGEGRHGCCSGQGIKESPEFGAMDKVTRSAGTFPWMALQDNRDFHLRGGRGTSI